jgi:hypothetical protein
MWIVQEGFMCLLAALLCIMNLKLRNLAIFSDALIVVNAPASFHFSLVMPPFTVVFMAVW